MSGSGWVTASFSVKEADLTLVLGSDSYTTSLSNVERVLIRHDDGTPSPPDTEPPVSATLGIDNVAARALRSTRAGRWRGADRGIVLQITATTVIDPLDLRAQPAAPSDR